MSQLTRSLYAAMAGWFLVLAPCVSLRAADPRVERSNWDNVKQLLPGEEIRVVLKDLKSHRGLVLTVSEDALVVRTAPGEQTFKREILLRVSSKGQSHRGRNATLGALIGGGAGAAIAASAPKYDRRFWVLIVGLPLGSMVGAATGAVMPTGGWHEVYRAR